MLAQMLRQGAHIVLGTQEVIAGFVVSCLCQRSHGQNRHILQSFHFFCFCHHFPGPGCHFIFQIAVFIPQEISSGF